jgi:rod shape-determining protein MreD
MNKTFKLAIISIPLLAFCQFLQSSSIFDFIAISGIKPDIALIVLIFIAYNKGSAAGQTIGFFNGLIEDFLSLSSLGFYSLIRTTLGLIYGLFEGSFTIDPVIIPVIFTLIGTILKKIFEWVVSSIFSLTILNTILFDSSFWIEILYNCILASFIFAFLKLFKIFSSPGRTESNGIKW